MKHFFRKNRTSFAVFDSQFPQKNPFAFRNAEINEYISKVKGFKAYTMSEMMPDKEAWFSHGYGISKIDFLENKKGYLKHYPQNTHAIEYLNVNKKYRVNLAYSYFLGETYTLLPFFERQKIPFVFVLYPGGCFAINNDSSDRMLKKIFKSKHFRGVIVTQKFTQEYLIDKHLCDPIKIEYIFGSFVQFKKEELRPKQLFGKDKKTFDICFVAAKYTEQGVDKGYDLFIETAKKLVTLEPDIFFHVVGGFNEKDIDVSDIKD